MPPPPPSCPFPPPRPCYSPDLCGADGVEENGRGLGQDDVAVVGHRQRYVHEQQAHKEAGMGHIGLGQLLTEVAEAAEGRGAKGRGKEGSGWR